MERAASEPTLRDDDYFVACHGVGDTGQANKTLHGPFSKDTGKFSSRIAIIIRQAEKVPGPGKYQGHEDWTLNGGSKFAKGERSYKPMHKNPDPTHYERKDIFGNPSNANKECLSNIPRITFGKMPKGKRRSFLDSSIRQGALTPGPGHYPMKTASANTLDIHQKGITKWDKEAKAGGKAKEDKSIAPNHYSINYDSSEAKKLTFTIPKEKASNFLDKAVREKMIDKKTKKELPGPGTYPQIDLDLTSRGTYHLQLRTLSRSAMSGYF